MSDRDTTFSVPKMKCDGCASTIRQALGHIVEAVDVDLEAKTVRVTLLPEGARPEDVRKALEQAGFPPQ